MASPPSAPFATTGLRTIASVEMIPTCGWLMIGIVSTEPAEAGGIVGYRAKKNAFLIDVDQIGHYEAALAMDPDDRLTYYNAR